MTAGVCTHQHGAIIRQFGCWVCGQCYSKIDQRPRKYAMRPIPRAHTGDGTTGDIANPKLRQEIVWQAGVRISKQGTSLASFLRAMARRFVQRAHVSEIEAYDYSLEALRILGEEFGSDQSDWSRAAAEDIANEELSLWDEHEPDELEDNE